MSISFSRGLLVGSILFAGCHDNSVKNLPSTPGMISSEKANRFNIDDYLVQPPIHYRNISVYPIVSRHPILDDTFITLDEGLRTGLIEISELATSNSPPRRNENMAIDSSIARGYGDSEDPFQSPALTENQRTTQESVSLPQSTNAFSGDPFEANGADDVDQLFQQRTRRNNQVNALVVTNRSDKALYLMPGEVIVGGSQDRTIGEEMLIAPNSQPVVVPVFCVEHGRWGAKGMNETRSQLQSASELQNAGRSVAVAENTDLEELAQQADEGKFVASVGQLGKMARVAVQSEKSQSKVWHEVSETNTKSGLKTSSDTFTANYANPDSNKRLEPYLEHLLDPIAKEKQSVGVIVAINGKFESIDLFHSTPLFVKLWPKLLKSYSLDAANSQLDSDRTHDTKRTVQEAKTFLEDAIAAEVVASENAHNMGLTKRDGKQVLSFTSHLQPASNSESTGGLGGMLHFSGYAK